MLVRIWHGCKVVREFRIPFGRGEVGIDPWARLISVDGKARSY